MTDDVAPHPETSQAPHRKRYTFTKRDPVAAAKLEQERVASIKHNPFGDAKPREAVIAERTGKDEAQVVEEEALTYEVHFKLTPDQFAEKKARQEEIDDLKASLDTGEPADADAIKADIAEKEAALESLVKGFEELLVQKAKAGEMPRVDRKPFVREEGAGGYGGGYGGEGGHTKPSNRGSFYHDQYEPSGGAGSYQQGGRDVNRVDGFGAGYGSGGAGGGYNKRRGGGRGGGRDYRESAGGGFKDGGYQDAAGYGGDDEGSYERHAVGGSSGGSGAGQRHYPMHADSSDYHPVHER